MTLEEMHAELATVEAQRQENQRMRAELRARAVDVTRRHDLLLEAIRATEGARKAGGGDSIVITPDMIASAEVVHAPGDDS